MAKEFPGDRYRLLVFGDAKVGKTSIIRRFLNNSFSDRYKPTTEDIYSRDFNLRNSLLPLDIYDTNIGNKASEKFYITSAHAFLLVFNVSNPESFKKLDDLVAHMNEVRDDLELVPIVVAGNQQDTKQKVKRETVEEWMVSKNLNSKARYLETSAKDCTNVAEIFQTLLSLSDFPTHKRRGPATLSSALGRTRSMRIRSPAGPPAENSSSSPKAIRSFLSPDIRDEEPHDNGGFVRSTQRLSLKLKKMALGESDVLPVTEEPDCRIS